MIILFLEMIYIHYCLKNQFYSLFHKIVLHKKTNTLIFQIYHNLMLNIVHQIVPSYLLCYQYPKCPIITNVPLYKFNYNNGRYLKKHSRFEYTRAHLTVAPKLHFIQKIEALPVFYIQLLRSIILQFVIKTFDKDMHSPDVDHYQIVLVMGTQ